MNRLITASLLVALVAILLATRTTPVHVKGSVERRIKVRDRRGERIVKMEYETWQCRYRLKSGDSDSSWRTFRDCDPSPFKSIFTGTGSVPLKGKWMDLDHRGEVST